MNCWKTWARTCGRLSTSFLCAVSMTAQTAPMFRASVALVHVDAEVTLEGRTLAGLTKDDFRVLDERRPQTVVQFASEEQALDLILLFDISGSMRPAVKAVASAARLGLQELREGDRVCIQVFRSEERRVGKECRSRWSPPH